MIPGFMDTSEQGGEREKKRKRGLATPLKDRMGLNAGLITRAPKPAGIMGLPSMPELPHQTQARRKAEAEQGRGEAVEEAKNKTVRQGRGRRKKEVFNAGTSQAY